MPLRFKDTTDKTKRCIKCGNNLYLGKFAYNQEMCWECFEAEVIWIAVSARNNSHRDIIIHMLNVMREAHHT